MNISKSEYEEYQQLKSWAKRENVYQSLESIADLQDDIDLPIRRCVAILTLLKCQPIFSCCGFDYKGQPFHKSHQYGLPYIKLTDNIFTTRLRASLENELFKYHWSFRQVGGEVFLEYLNSANPAWRDSNCIHQSEEYVIGIQCLENSLMSQTMFFSDIETLKDTNQRYKNDLMRFWQYPAKKPWVIHKEDIPLIGVP